MDVWHLLQFLVAFASVAAHGAAEQTARVAAVAALIHAAEGDQGDHEVPGLQRAQAQGQGVPGWSLLGRMHGWWDCRSLSNTTRRITRMRGTPTPTSTGHPASERPNTVSGTRQKMTR